MPLKDGFISPIYGPGLFTMQRVAIGTIATVSNLFVENKADVNILNVATQATMTDLNVIANNITNILSVDTAATVASLRVSTDLRANTTLVNDAKTTLVKDAFCYLATNTGAKYWTLDASLEKAGKIIIIQDHSKVITGSASIRIYPASGAKISGFTSYVDHEDTRRGKILISDGTDWYIVGSTT